jgi:LysR family transcriptional regulator, glycine cleavage system transcriptional activator
VRTPSTQALRALDAFARHGTVWKAAEELRLTRSAVSHQLRLLEQELGFTLFNRIGKGVGLTARGRRYATDIRKALALIGEAGQHDDRGIGGACVVSCTPGFASLWLCTHIGEFVERYPDVALKIRTPRRLDEVISPEVDIFIAFGDGNWPNRSVELLSEVEFTPLCSPVLLNKAGGFNEPADLLKVPILHLTDAEDWTRWFTLAGVEVADPEAGIIFSDMNLLLAATSAGQGVALGDELTCGPAMAAGTLVRPFEKTVKSLRAYYLVMEMQKTANPTVRAFSDWLRRRLAETAKEHRSPWRANHSGE